MDGPGEPAMTRDERKRAEIRKAALEVFLEGGFLAATVDEIAAAAHTSKRTVYHHFDDKTGLFRAAIRGTIAPMQRSLADVIERAASHDARSSLHGLVRGLMQIIVTPDVARLRRVVIAEADRFPDLAAEWYELGPAQTIDRLERYLARLDSAGEISVPDVRTAAEQLLWLTISTPLNRLMFAPSGTSEASSELERVADAAFETFWTAFGRPQHHQR